MAIKMSEDELNGVKKIFEDRDYHALSGEQANAMCHQLQKKAKVDHEGIDKKMK